MLLGPSAGRPTERMTPVIAQAPQGEVEVPAIVVELAEGRAIRAVWQNEGGLTFQIGDGPGRRFVKWIAEGGEDDLRAEAERLRWAVRYTAVPRVLDLGSDATGSWMLTAGLPGRTAVDDHWKRDPASAVRAVGAGLRAMHEELPTGHCPFSWSAEERLATARARAAAGRTDPADWHDDMRRFAPVERAVEALADPPPVDRLVVCHGDACAPNTLIGDDGTWTGHVDLGALGVGDRWADLAVATWSTTWNYGPGWEEPLLEAYGVEPDPQRTRYYRLLWELSS